MPDSWDIGPHNGWYDDDNKILVFEVNGEFTIDQYMRHKEIQQEAFEGRDEKRHVIYKINEKLDISKDTRKALKEDLASGQESSQSDKIAFVGVTPGTRMVIKIWVKVLRMTEAGFFDTYDEAVDWVRK